MKKIGLKTKVVGLCIIFTLLLAGGIGFSGYYLYADSVMKKYSEYADVILDMVDYSAEKYDLAQMIKDRSMGDDYAALGEDLNAMKEVSSTAYIYVIYYEDPEDIYSIRYATYGSTKAQLEADPDEPAYMGKPSGDGDFDDGMRKACRDSLVNKERKLCIYDNNTDKYGHIISYYKVMYDGDDNAVGLICVDIDVKEINSNIYRYLAWVFMLTLVLMLIFVTAFSGAVSKSVTDPVIRITNSTSGFVQLLEGAVKPENITFNDPRVHSYDEIGMLARNVTKMAETVRDYMKNLENVTREKERIGAELKVATQIQADMLPRIFPAFPEHREFDIFATMTPAKEVGGDFYDYFLMDDNHLVLVMADVSGKGVPAALFMVIAKTLIKNRAQMGGGPAEILTDVNAQLFEGNDMDLFVTVWLAVIDLRTGKGLAANAGHEHPAIKRRGGKWELSIYRHSLAVAAMEYTRFREHEFELHPGDSVFVYTDGVAEAADMHNVLFGQERMLTALNREPDARPDKLLRNVKAEIDAYIGNAPQFDDITMMGFVWYGEEGTDGHPGDK